MTSGTIKYRAACDHCSATKIKCTQERPSCARCRALGRDCHYSRSLRAGKPPRSSQGLNRRLSNAPVLPRKPSIPEPIPRMHNLAMCHDLNYGFPIPTPTAKPDPTWTSNSGSYPTPPAMTPYCHPDMSFFADLAQFDTSNASTPSIDPEWFFDFNTAAATLPSNDILPSSMEPKTPMQQPSPGSTDSSKRPSCTSSTSDYQVPEAMMTMPPSTPPGGPTSPPLNPCGGQCIKVATDTLNKLYEMPHIQEEESHTKQFSVDQVLSSTSQSVQTCLDLIACPCQKDFYIPILIAIIASKILAWYQAVAFIRDPQTDSAPHASFESIEQQQENATPLHRELVVDGQLALGAYKLDDQMGWVLKNHIVLGQLQRLSDIVNRYEIRFCGGPSGMRNGAEAVGVKWYGEMGNFLRQRLGFTVRQIEGRLMNGTPG